MGGVLVEGVVGATTVVGVALLTEEAGGDTALNEGEQFKTFSLAYIHAPSPYYGIISGGQRMLPLLPCNWFSYI